MCSIRYRFTAYNPCILCWVMLAIYPLSVCTINLSSLSRLLLPIPPGGHKGWDQLPSTPSLRPFEPVTIWEPHDPTALPTPEEKRLNDGVLHILSSQLLAARQLVHGTGELPRQHHVRIDHIEREIALRRHYAAPVRTLPAEILAEIGMIVATRSDTYHWKAIWIFSWTCRAWRDALLANPKVWGVRIVVPPCRDPLSLVIAARRYARGSHVSLSADIHADFHRTIDQNKSRLSIYLAEENYCIRSPM